MSNTCSHVQSLYMDPGSPYRSQVTGKSDKTAWLTDLSLHIQLYLCCKNASLLLPLLLSAQDDRWMIFWEISDIANVP